MTFFDLFDPARARYVCYYHLTLFRVLSGGIYVDFRPELERRTLTLVLRDSQNITQPDRQLADASNETRFHCQLQGSCQVTSSFLILSVAQSLNCRCIPNHTPLRTLPTDHNVRPFSLLGRLSAPCYPLVRPKYSPEDPVSTAELRRDSLNRPCT